jgi:hypothetical protein
MRTLDQTECQSRSRPRIIIKSKLVTASNHDQSAIFTAAYQALPSVQRLFETAVANSNLSSSRINPSKLNSLIIRKRIHRSRRDIKSSSGMINSEYINALSLVGELPASTAVGGVPACDGLGTADVRKLGDLALGLPLVLCDKTVFAVGTGDGCEGAAGFAIAGVVGDCRVLVGDTEEDVGDGRTSRG